jgi:phosphatidylglycerophosphatase C
MVGEPVTAERVDAQAVILRLERARIQGRSGLAFDADGTLWSGDVGEDVFEWACSRELLREESHEALARVATAHALSAEGSPSRIASSLYAAYLAGSLLERTMCEIMTWCYAGFSLDELRDTARQAFAERGLEGRRREVLLPIFDWAARERLRVVVVSASPFPIVDEALGVVGIRVAGLAAARAETIRGRIAPRMAEAVPYAAEKPVSGERLLEGHDWLGSFGDNAFDIDMLRAARVGVAVCPKPLLAARLHELSNTVVLE